MCNVEEAKMKIVRDPGSPTAEERAKHDMTHNPYRSWCPVCVEAKGKEDPHHRVHGEKREGVNVVGLDYKTFGQDNSDEKMTIMVMRDRDTMMTFVHQCERKGPADEWVIDEIVGDIASLGYPKII